MNNIDCYERVYRTARKVHNCDFCGMQIEKGEKYSYESWKDCGKFWNLKLCLLCDKMIKKFVIEEKPNDYIFEDVCEWLFSEYCYCCDYYNGCQYPHSGIPECPHIRKHFENLESN